ncbi:MAG TPA: tRNA pseudouridine(38-40) synthase TruA [Vicinamibacterales bacterium]|nr:tRNA pseudouridine(38-40) synthase TruA [Vicinamibacterales bacterium]
MPRFKLTIEYAGTRYSGWQRQQNARTVQGELHRAIQTALGPGPFETYGSGRTDAGVHALAQVAHLDTKTTLPPATLLARVNDALPADINILSVERVPPRFHARHSAIARSYLYQISRRRSAFAKPFVWWVREPLDVAVMHQAGAALAGFGDFRAFTDDDPEEKSTHVLLESITIRESDDLILVRVTGSHFLWKMVRRIVGVLVEVGRGGLQAEQVASLLSSTSDLPPKLTASASGLFLERVWYEPPPAPEPLRPAVFSR